MTPKEIATHLGTLCVGSALTIGIGLMAVSAEGVSTESVDVSSTNANGSGPEQTPGAPDEALQPIEEDLGIGQAVADWELRLCRARLVSLEGAHSEWTPELRDLVGPESSALDAVESDLVAAVPDAFDIRHDCDEYPCVLAFRIPADLRMEHPGPPDVATAAFTRQFEEQAPFEEMRTVLAENQMGGGTLSCKRLGADQMYCGFAAGMPAGSGPDAYQRSAARLKSLMLDAESHSDTGSP